MTTNAFRSFRALALARVLVVVVVSKMAPNMPAKRVHRMRLPRSVEDELAEESRALIADFNSTESAKAEIDAQMTEPGQESEKCEEVDSAQPKEGVVLSLALIPSLPQPAIRECSCPSRQSFDLFKNKILPPPITLTLYVSSFKSFPISFSKLKYTHSANLFKYPVSRTKGRPTISPLLLYPFAINTTAANIDRTQLRRSPPPMNTSSLLFSFPA